MPLIPRALKAVPAPDAGGEAEPLENLLPRVASGDRNAYEQVYERVSAPVYGVVRRVLRDPAQSEEVAQEVMLQVWTSAARFDRSQGSAMTWVMTIAHRRAVDRVRAETSRSRTAQRSLDEHQSVPYDSVADEVATRLDQQAVRSCLAALTAMQRQAVTLAYYDGLTYREVAGNLGIPDGTAKTRIRDGLLRLRDCLSSN